MMKNQKIKAKMTEFLPIIIALLIVKKNRLKQKHQLKQKTVTETVQEKSTQNVNHETVVKQTVSTEILSTEQTGGTVTKTVEKQVPKQVTKNVEETVEREVEREIVNENGETENCYRNNRRYNHNSCC